jgi:tyrosine-protein kinase Etk/Wzc
MNQPIKNTGGNNESNLLQLISFRLLPYWPLLGFFTVICTMSAILYLKLATPTYEATAILLVKDEKKGSDDSRMIEALNVFHSKKIVENEIEVLHSRSLMKEVVKSLGLYAPVSMESKFRITSAYITSPIIVKAKDPDKINEVSQVYFTYDYTNKLVKIGNQAYPIETWVKTPYGELMFSANVNLKKTNNNLLFFSLRTTKAVVNDLLKKLNVSAANKLSSVVNLQFVDEVPDRAEDVLDELIIAYNRAGMNDKNALADNTMQFVDERLKHVKSDIDSIEKKVQTYRSKQGAINLSEQSSVFLKNVGDNDQKAAVIDMQLAVLNQVQKFVNSGKSIGGIVPSTLGIDDPVLSQLLTRLSNTELEYEKLKNTTGANNPMLVSLSNELKQLRPNILESIRIQKINLKASSDQIKETNKKYSETLQTIPEKERSLLEISRQQTIINNVYNFLLQKKEETALSYASTVPDSRVLDVAEASIKPVSPKKVIALPVALVIAFVLTFGVIYFKDFASNKIMFRSEIASISTFPVIGEIAYLKKKFFSDSSKREYITQQLFKIIASIGLFNKDNSIKKILITSTLAGEGKSLISLNLAKVIAESGKKVVVVDLDFKKSTTTNTLLSQKVHGVSEFLMEQTQAFDIIHSTEYNNIYVVVAGERQLNYAALFSTGRMEQLFSYLEQSFDYIIIDTSSIDPLSDDLILSQFGDVILYIVRHAFTPKALFKVQSNNSSLIDTNNVGIIFNGVKSRGYLNGFGYGYGYEYSYKQSSEKHEKKDKKVELIKDIK